MRWIMAMALAVSCAGSAASMPARIAFTAAPARDVALQRETESLEGRVPRNATLEVLFA